MKKLPDMDQIIAFLAVAEELSFKRAAERLAIDASALSRRIKDLEGRLGFQLLFRTTQTVQITEAGRRFFDGNQDIVGSLRETIASAARVSKGSVGHLRIGYMTFAGLTVLPAAVAHYREVCPEISLSLSYQSTQDQKTALTRGEIDIGLMLGPFQHSEFDVRLIATEGLLGAVPDGHRLVRKKKITASDLSTEPLVLGTDRHWDFYRNRVESALGLQGLELRIEYEASNMLGMLGLVRAGLGVTIVPEAMRDYCPDGIVMRRIAGSENAIQTIAVWRTPAENTVREFLKVLTE